MIPGIGPLLVAGPLVSWIVGALEGAVVVGGLSALGAGFFSLGIPRDSILQYETALKTGKFVVIAHGTAEEAAHAREIIHHTNPELFFEHQAPHVLSEPQAVNAWEQLKSQRKISTGLPPVPKSTATVNPITTNTR